MPRSLCLDELSKRPKGRSLLVLQICLPSFGPIHVVAVTLGSIANSNLSQPAHEDRRFYPEQCLVPSRPVPGRSLGDVNTLICDGFRWPLQRSSGLRSLLHDRCPGLIQRDETLCP